MSMNDMKRQKTKSPSARQNSTYSKGSSSNQTELLTGKFGDQNRPDEGF